MVYKSMSKQNNSTSVGLAFALFGFAVYSSHDAIVKSLKDYHVFQVVFFAMLFSYCLLYTSDAADE